MGDCPEHSTPTPIEIALVPLTSYLTSLLFSLFVQKPMVKILKNRLLPMGLALAIVTASSIPMLSLEDYDKYMIYPLAAI